MRCSEPGPRALVAIHASRGLVNIPESLHRRAQSLAQDDGVPLDQFIATALAEKVAVLDADSYLRERAARGSREKFEHVLSKVPDVEPEEHDRLSPQNAA